jgi:uncharacterized protein DUF4185
MRNLLLSEFLTDRARAVVTLTAVAFAALAATACTSEIEAGRRRSTQASSDDGPSGGRSGSPTLAGPVDPLALRPAFTERLGQLTTTALSPAPAGMQGTDLGVSFLRDDKLVFLFGDTLSQDPALRDVDTVAFAPLALPAKGVPQLTWSPAKLALPGIALGTMNVPVEGVPVGDDTYVFFATRYDATSNVYGASTLARAKGTAFESLEIVHDVPSTHFVNVSVVVDGADAYVYGSGRDYRASAVHLAKVPLANIGDRAAWRYRDATGAFVDGEANAAPIIDAKCVGELSVRKHPTLALYVLAYNCLEPRGVWLHLAATPAGPWTPAGNIFEAGEGYGRFMHSNETVAGYDDGLSGAGAENDWGGEYAPYFVPSWFTSDGNAIGLVYVLSSWNPYQVHVMRTWLAPPGEKRARPERGVGLPKATLVNGDFATGDLSGWQAQGDAFVTFQSADGVWRMTTFTPDKGDAATGTLSQSFTVDAATSELSFSLHGGDGRVTLRHGDDIVRSSHGRRSNESTETLVRWNIEEYRGETLRVVIEDDLAAAWGFVGARGFTLK